MGESMTPAAQDDMPYALTVEDLAAAPKAWVIDEVLRLRKLLTQCWDATGLLGANMTGQPFQAWEEPSDLLGKIEELASDAQSYRDGPEDEPPYPA